MMPQTAFNALRVEGLILTVNLGYTAAERSRRQEVRLAIELRFRAAPLGAATDVLGDTICYAKLADAIRRHCESREYQLIEKMAHEIYAVARGLAGQGVEVGISLHKVRPPVENLDGGVFFRCGDFIT